MKLEDYSKYYIHYIQGTNHYLIPKDVFVELYREMEAWKEQAKKKEMIRLDQTKKVFDTIAKVIKEGSCSYRHLIYDELGFDGKYYEELLSGMTITNAISDLEELREQLEEYKDKINWYENFEVNKTIDKLRLKHNIQQQEFINYLEDEIKTLEKDILETIDDMDRYMKEVKSLIIEEILQKYKEIVGVSKIPIEIKTQIGE